MKMKPAIPLLAATFAVMLAGADAIAQGLPAAPKPTSGATADKVSPPPVSVRLDADQLPERTFYLKNVSQGSEANEVFTALRNLLPASTKALLVPSQDAIVIRGTPDDIAATQKLLDELDRPRKTYRLSFTVTEVDGTKPVGVQHYSMVVASGQQTTLKQGSRVPLVTGSLDAGGKTQSTQISYIDVGMNFDATLVELGNGAELRSTVERSSAAPELSGVGPQDPVVRATSVKGEAHLVPGVPLVLGSADIPDSTRHLDVEVVMERLP
jgi:type II secretory pathway component GspD/PulD (secretin)